MELGGRLASVFSLLFISVALAQPALQVVPGELALPFGTAAGKLVILPDALVFVDDEQPGASFMIARADVKEVTGEKEVVSILTTRNLRDRSGERNRFSFRFATAPGAAHVMQWHSAAPPVATPGTGAVGEEVSFQARHSHRIGGCRGKLIVTEDRLIYESVSEVSDTRRWTYKEIKELKRDNPYELKVSPFEGADFSFRLEGSGMESDVFKRIVDRVTSARSGTR